METLTEEQQLTLFNEEDVKRVREEYEKKQCKID